MYKVTIKWNDDSIIDKSFSNFDSQLQNVQLENDIVNSDDGIKTITHYFNNFNDANDFLNGKVIYNNVYIIYHKKNKRFKRFVKREYINVDENNKPYICIATDNIMR